MKSEKRIVSCSEKTAWRARKFDIGSHIVAISDQYTLQFT